MLSVEIQPLEKFYVKNTVVDVKLELGNTSASHEPSLSLQQGLKHITGDECNVTMKCNCCFYAILCI